MAELNHRANMLKHNRLALRLSNNWGGKREAQPQ
jgi:hypothetical protein